MDKPFKSSDKIPYDPWFDYIPAAINDTYNVDSEREHCKMDN